MALKKQEQMSIPIEYVTFYLIIGFGLSLIVAGTPHIKDAYLFGVIMGTIVLLSIPVGESIRTLRKKR